MEKITKVTGVIVLIVCIALFMRVNIFTRALKVTYTNQTVEVSDYIGRHVKILCITEQMTDSWFCVLAIETNTNEFSYFDNGHSYPIVVEGNDPFSVLNNEDLLAPTDPDERNLFVLEGNLWLMEDEGLYMDIINWDIVYPIKGFLRLPFMDNYLYTWDIKEN